MSGMAIFYVISVLLMLVLISIRAREIWARGYQHGVEDTKRVTMAFDRKWDEHGNMLSEFKETRTLGAKVLRSGQCTK